MILTPDRMRQRILATVQAVALPTPATTRVGDARIRWCSSPDPDSSLSKTTHLPTVSQNDNMRALSPNRSASRTNPGS
jgi:hypothetical protein